MRRFRAILLALAFAALGVVAGKLVARARRPEDVRDPAEMYDSDIPIPGMRELVPGLVAALRVGDRPWSYLHIPPWLAAFAVNFAVAAFGRDLPFLKAMGVGGGEPPWASMDATPSTSATPAPPGSPNAGPWSPPDPPQRSPASEVWTAARTGPGGDARPGGSYPGFQPSSE